MTALVTGVVVLNVGVAAVGYALLAPTLRGCSPRGWASFAGIAVLVGWGACGVVLCVLAIAGLTIDVRLLAVVGGSLSLAGMAAAASGRRRRAGVGPAATHRAPASTIGEFGATASAAALAVLGLAAIFAAFRTSPWLDDSYSFWLPKGLLLARDGLDARVFAPDEDYVQFTNPDYPLWWSIVGGLDIDAVGRVDLRALNGQIAIVAVAFVGAAARLLWGHVRPWLLWPTLLAFALSPELLNQTQSGGADIPLAAYAGLAGLTGALWLLRGARELLFGAFLFAAVAVNLKVEGVPMVVALVAVPGLLTARALGRRAWLLVAAAAGATATLAPWTAWRAVHGVEGAFSVSEGLDPRHLAGQTERILPSAEAILRMTTGTRWPLVLPLFAAVVAAGALIDRGRAWWVPPASLLVGFALLVWIYWAGTRPLDDWLLTSAFRVPLSLLFAAAAVTPLLADRALTARAERRERNSAEAH